MKSSARGNFIRAAISLGALGFLIYSLHDKLGHAIQILRSEVIWAWFLLAVVTYGAALAIISVRLQWVFKAKNIRLTFPESYYLTFIGQFFNIFLPSAVGGDVAKIYFAYKQSGQKISSTTAVVMDRLMGFVALISMAIIGVFFFSCDLGDSRIDHLVYLFMGIMILCVGFFASRRFANCFGFLGFVVPIKWREQLKGLYNSMHDYKQHKKVLLMTVLLSLAGQSLFVLLQYFVMRSLDVHLSVWLFFVLVPVIAIVSMAPSLGGLGVREAGMVFLFQRFMPSERALALSLLLDVIIYGYSFAAGLVFSQRGGLKGANLKQMEALD